MFLILHEWKVLIFKLPWLQAAFDLGQKLSKSDLGGGKDTTKNSTLGKREEKKKKRERGFKNEDYVMLLGDFSKMSEKYNE